MNGTALLFVAFTGTVGLTFGSITRVIGFVASLVCFPVVKDLYPLL